MKSKLNISKRKLKKFIEQKYNLSIKKITYTCLTSHFYGYTLKDTRGRNHFLKILIKNKKEAYNRVQLKEKLQKEFYLMFGCKLDFISYPIVTINGNFFIDFNDHVMILYRHLDGSNQIKKMTEKQLEQIGENLALLHNCYTIISKNMYKKEKRNLKSYKKIYNTFLSTKKPHNDSKYVVKLQKILTKDQKKIQKIIEGLQKKEQKLLLKKNLILTHGDLVKGNMIVSKHGVSITGLDNLSYARIEKDFAFFAKNTDLKHVLLGYKKIIPKAKPQKQRFIFYYKYLLIKELVEAIEDLTGGHHNAIKKAAVKNLTSNILPKIRNIEKKELEIKKIL